jgi:hypothetical protein
MREPRRPSRGKAGFSMVEMLVALLFMGLFMAGMTKVFKSSINTFYTTSEGIASARRNRASIDLLYDDLNSIGLYLQDLQAPPQGLGSAVPPFFILPRQKVSTAAGQPAFADQIFFYVDQPFQFQAKIDSVDEGANNQALYVDKNLKLSDYKPGYTIDCGSYVYAKQVYDAWKAGLPVSATLQDSYQVLNLTTVTEPANNSNLLKVSSGASADVSVTGVGAAGGPNAQAHIKAAAATFFVPAQMIRYSIQMIQLDPSAANTDGTPCLVRDQGSYNSGAFTATPSLQQILAENVADFRAYVSVNPGYLTVHTPTQAWAPFPARTLADNATLDTGWTSGILNDVRTQLKDSGRAGVTTIDSVTDPTWFRNVPLVLRVDISTRTATQRADYAPAGTTALAYKTITRSMVMVPRHFGLPLK